MNQTEIPTLETLRLSLEKIKSEDQELIFRGLSHPEVIKYYGVSYSSFQETKEQMEWYTNLEKSNSGMWWAIWLKDSKEFCGAIGYNGLMEEHKKAELGFWLLPEFWGKGIVQEAGQKVIQYFFRDLELHRIEAYVEAGNINSSKALKRLGFEHEGCLRDSEFKNGQFISVDIFALLNPTP
ncbi:GNAT family N-acetyltransferase [Christiangramia aestuarii]|uniref:GNAT family N-acetyltransferase n=1 Tax=Christiangramia aestuarii TaxID=1028746 RepID=UPI0012E2BF5A|nr:GNAT family protein [Christiangramia aestuarii]